MTDPRRESGSGRGERTTADSSDKPSNPAKQQGQQSKTAGTDRDFDENQESKNQGHGHPREERTGG